MPMHGSAMSTGLAAGHWRFQERLETIVTGTLADDGKVLHATDLVAKCPDDYSTLPSWPEHGGPR